MQPQRINPRYIAILYFKERRPAFAECLSRLRIQCHASPTKFKSSEGLFIIHARCWRIFAISALTPHFNSACSQSSSRENTQVRFGYRSQRDTHTYITSNSDTETPQCNKPWGGSFSFGIRMAPR